MQEDKEFNAVSTSESEGANEGGATGSSLHLGSAGGAMPQRSRDQEPDYYFENGFLVFTATFLKNRGWCCGNGCRHCPYTPKYQRGNNQW